jgi:hypothetical protein
METSKSLSLLQLALQVNISHTVISGTEPLPGRCFLQTRVHEIKGRRLDAKAAVPKAHLGTAKLTKKMFVGGTGDLTDEDFRQHFAQFGEVEDAAVSIRMLCVDVV